MQVASHDSPAMSAMNNGELSKKTGRFVTIARTRKAGEKWRHIFTRNSRINVITRRSDVFKNRGKTYHGGASFKTIRNLGV